MLGFSLRWASILERKPRRRLGRPSECWGHVGATFFLAHNFFKDSPSFTSERSYVQFSHIPVGYWTSSHFVSAPISPRVSYVTSCPPQYGILEVIRRGESEKPKHARLQRSSARRIPKALPQFVSYMERLRSRVMRDVRKTVMNVTLAP